MLSATRRRDLRSTPSAAETRRKRSALSSTQSGGQAASERTGSTNALPPRSFCVGRLASWRLLTLPACLLGAQQRERFRVAFTRLRGDDDRRAANRDVGRRRDVRRIGNRAEPNELACGTDARDERSGIGVLGIAKRRAL